MFRNVWALASFIVSLSLISAVPSYADIEWQVYFKKNITSPVVTKTVREGEEFVIREAECQRIPSESGDILTALDGVSFMLRQSPVSGALSIHVILNVNGNTFEPASGIPLFLNVTFEAYVNGVRENYLTFSRSPLELTIPQQGLSALLSACNLSRTNLVCAFSAGGKFSAEGIETQDATTRMIIRMTKPATAVGGNENDLGVPSAVKFDTWSKIKLLFK